jgi:hypothetical protein
LICSFLAQFLAPDAQISAPDAQFFAQTCSNVRLTRSNLRPFNQSPAAIPIPVSFSSRATPKNFEHLSRSLICSFLAQFLAPDAQFSAPDAKISAPDAQIFARHAQTYARHAQIYAHLIRVPLRSRAAPPRTPGPRRCARRPCRAGQTPAPGDSFFFII